MTDGYEVVVFSDGDALAVRVEGPLTPTAQRDVAGIALAAQKLGIPVRLDCTDPHAEALREG